MRCLADDAFYCIHNQGGIWVTGCAEIVMVRYASESDEMILWEQAEKLGKIGHWMWDSGLQECTYCSPGLASLFGISVDEYLRLSKNPYGLLDWVHADDRKRYQYEVDQFSASQVPQGECKDTLDLEYRIVDANGTNRHLRETAVSLVDEEHHPVRAVGTVQDISNNKHFFDELIRNQDQLNHAAHAASLCYWRADSTMQVWLETSDNTDEILGADAKSMLGSLRKFDSLMTHPDDLPRVASVLSTAASKGEPYEVEYRVIDNDDKIRFLWEKAEPEFGKDGRIVSYRGATQNITKRKVAELNAITAREEAEKASKAKSVFLSAMSHELRTPLNAIIGFSEALQMGIAKDDHEKQNEILEVTARTGRQLDQLIGDLLDFTVIEQGNVEYDCEWILPATIFEECMPIIKKLVADRNLEFRGIKKSSNEVYVDSNRLRQILLNFISNAVKYNVEGGKIEFGCVEIEDSMLRIYVKDTGIGIPEDKTELVFSPFDRIRFESIDTPGTGLGLTICKKFAEAMDGRIGFTSTVGKGSTFWVEFPSREQIPQISE